MFALAAAAFFLSFFHRVAPGAVAAELTGAFAVSGAALGALAATYFYVYAVMQVPTGVLVDTLGPRRVLAAGCLVGGVGSIIFGLAPTLPVAFAGRTLVGVGVSVAFVSLLKVTANWFDERRFATASAFANGVGVMGAVMATEPLAWLVAHVSWRAVFAAAGVLSLLLAAATWAWAQDAPHPGGTAGRKAVQPPAAADRWWPALAEVLRNRATWPGFWVTFGISGSYMSFIGLWIVPFLSQVYGMSAIEAGRHASLTIVCSAVSLIAYAALSDRIGSRRPLVMVSALLYLLCWGAWLLGVPRQWTYAMAGAMGVVMTGFSLAWACAKEVNRPRYAGMAVAVVNTGAFVAAGVLQPLVGWVLDRSAGGAANAVTLELFRPALLVLGGFTLIGVIGALFIRETRCRNIWSPTPLKP